jgi:hypothetical protein
MTGWGGSLTIGGTTIPIRSVTISRQASEFNITAHGDLKQFSGPGRVKRGGSFEAYVSGATGAVETAIETPNLATPATITFTSSAGGVTTMSIIITGADQVHGSEDAAIYSVSFTETMVLA